jgi:hypothetical protein
MSNKTVIEHLMLDLEAAQRADCGVDWVSDRSEVLTIAEASELAGCSAETCRRWCNDFEIGRLFAGSLWLVSRRRLLALIERRSGKAAMLAAASRGKKHVRSLSSSLSIRVGTTDQFLALAARLKRCMARSRCGCPASWR